MCLRCDKLSLAKDLECTAIIIDLFAAVKTVAIVKGAGKTKQGKRKREARSPIFSVLFIPLVLIKIVPKKRTVVINVA